MEDIRTITKQIARQLVITKQHLDNTPTPASMLDVIRDLGCLQLDPISAVARSHQLVLFSRLGNYDLEELDRLLYQDRSLFEYWAHVASIVLTEDYPIHAYRMRHYATWSNQIQTWLDELDESKLHDSMLQRLHKEGPLPSRVFKNNGANFPESSGWTSSNNVPRMIDYLWQTGQIMVAKREGIQRHWDIAERCLPDWAPREQLNADQVTRAAAQKAIRALGVATAAQIKEHYTRHRYYDLERILKALEAEQVIQQVQVIDEHNQAIWKGTSYIHTQDIPLLERLQSGTFYPQTTLLSPFDNLICDRKRTEQLFDFYFRIEIYVPKDKRQYGYYVLPILQGDKLIGRMDARMDRKTATLYINAVYAEDKAPDDNNTVNAIRENIQLLGAFLEATTIHYGDVVPEQWRSLTH